MQLTAHILALAAIVVWPVAVMMAPIVFDAESEARFAPIPIALTLFFYPVLFGIWFDRQQWGFLGLTSGTFLTATVVIPSIAAVVFGLPQMLFNWARGVTQCGYTVKPRAVYFDAHRVAQADPATFKVLQNRFPAYAVDARHVFVNGEILAGADASKFELLPDLHADQHRWARDGERVYFANAVAAGADPATFQRVPGGGEDYWRDASHVYWGHARIEGAEVASFEYLKCGAEPSGFVRDAAGVYRHGVRLEQVDPARFVVLSTSGYGHDGEHVVFETRIVEGADPRTFKVLNDSLAKDAAHIYRDGLRILPEANARRFELLGDWRFARDDRHVYFLDRRPDQMPSIIPNADPDTFMKLDKAYAKDKTRVFAFWGQDVVTISEADASTFEALSLSAAEQDFDAQDRYRRYKFGKPV